MGHALAGMADFVCCFGLKVFGNRLCQVPVRWYDGGDLAPEKVDILEMTSN